MLDESRHRCTSRYVLRARTWRRQLRGIGMSICVKLERDPAQSRFTLKCTRHAKRPFERELFKTMQLSIFVGSFFKRIFAKKHPIAADIAVDRRFHVRQLNLWSCQREKIG